jgi:hypothetical protein
MFTLMLVEGMANAATSELQERPSPRRRLFLAGMVPLNFVTGYPTERLPGLNAWRLCGVAPGVRVAG